MSPEEFAGPCPIAFHNDREHFGDFLRRGGHTLSLASPLLGISAKMLKKSKNLENVGTLMQVSERVQMHLSRSEQVPALLRSYENLENLLKASRKLRETRASAVVDLSSDVSSLKKLDYWIK